MPLTSLPPSALTSFVKTNSCPRGERWGRPSANDPSDVGTNAKPEPQLLVERLRLASERIHHSGNRADSARALMCVECFQSHDCGASSALGNLSLDRVFPFRTFLCHLKLISYRRSNKTHMKPTGMNPTRGGSRHCFTSASALRLWLGHGRAPPDRRPRRPIRRSPGPGRPERLRSAPFFLSIIPSDWNPGP